MATIRKKFKGRIVAVTGASAGIGRAIAREFAREGADIALLSRNEERLQEAAKEIEDFGVKVLPIPVDVSDADAVFTAADRIEEELGPIDVWVNNAMLTVFSPVKKMQPEEYARVTDTTYLGVVHGTLAVLRRMQERDQGVIIQVGSALAYRAIPLQSAYCAAKHAVRGFTESLRTELLHDNSKVKVSMVQLPGINTPQFEWSKSKVRKHPKPMPPIYQPEVAARAVVWTAEHPRKELYVGFTTVLTILGNKVASAALDRYLAKNGYESQMMDRSLRAGRPENLWESPDGQYAAHGRFDERARWRSPHLWLTTHRKSVTAVALAALALAAGIAQRKGGTSYE